MKQRIRIGTRSSRLARAQSQAVADLLMHAHPDVTCTLVPMTTRGDESQARNEPLPPTGAKGLFTAELEDALLQGEIDCAVHSCKDLPVIETAQFTFGAIPRREKVHDVWISRSGLAFKDVPDGTVVGTSSVRRRAQLLHLNPSLILVELRGNIDTRLRRLKEGMNGIEGILLAAAGLERLKLTEQITHHFSLEDLLPAPAQGALAVQCCTGNKEIQSFLNAIHDKESGIAVTAERAFVRALGASCNTPIAGLAEVRGSKVLFQGQCLSLDGTKVISVKGEDEIEKADELGTLMGASALEQGFQKLDD